MHAVDFLLVLLGTQLSGCLAVCTRRGVECLEYEVIAKNNDYEERQYPASTWVSTTLEGHSLSEAMRAMYKKLFFYIQGTNTEGKFINTTTPVRTRVVPCSGATCPSVFTMSFLMPADVEAPPSPTDPSLFLEQEQPRRYVVRAFGGRPTEHDWIEEAHKLAEIVKKDFNIEKSHYYIAWYDPPMQLFNRLNEAWLEVKPASQPVGNDLF